DSSAKAGARSQLAAQPRRRLEPSSKDAESTSPGVPGRPCTDADRRPRVVAVEVGPFLDPAQRGTPLAERKVAVAIIANGRDKIGILHNPFAALGGASGNNRLSGQVLIQCAGHVDIVFANEEAKHRANAGIHVVDLISPVPGVMPITEIQRPLVT